MWPVPSVHLAPTCRPTTWSPARPAPPPQFQRVLRASGRGRRRARPTRPRATDGAASSPTTSSPVAGRAWCFDVKLNSSSLHGITTFTDSCPAGARRRRRASRRGRPARSTRRRRACRHRRRRSSRRKPSRSNQLARREVAIVSPHAGTTRDVIEVQLDLDGYPVTVIDTAGIRETDDPVEQEGVRRARARAADADLVLWLSDLPQVRDPARRDRAGLDGAKQDRSRRRRVGHWPTCRGRAVFRFRRAVATACPS